MQTGMQVLMRVRRCAKAVAKEEAAAARARPPSTAAASPAMPTEMPALLGEWGCDDELWVAIRSKKKLMRFAECGREVDARRFIQKVRNLVRRRPSPPPRSSARR